MAEAPKKLLCPDCGRRYSDPATIRSGQCPRCQGELVPIPTLRSGLPELRDKGKVRGKRKR